MKLSPYLQLIPKTEREIRLMRFTSSERVIVYNGTKNKYEEWNGKEWKDLFQSGNFSQLQTDWNESDINSPAYFKNRPREKDILAIRTDAEVNGIYNIDLSKGTIFRLTMTADTIFTISNLPISIFGRAFTVILSGDFVPTFPDYCVITPSSDTYSGTVRNRLIFDIIDGTEDKEDIILSIENLT